MEQDQYVKAVFERAGDIAALMVGKLPEPNGTTLVRRCFVDSASIEHAAEVVLGALTFKAKAESGRSRRLQLAAEPGIGDLVKWTAGGIHHQGVLLGFEFRLVPQQKWWKLTPAYERFAMVAVPGYNAPRVVQPGLLEVVRKQWWAAEAHA